MRSIHFLFASLFFISSCEFQSEKTSLDDELYQLSENINPTQTFTISTNSDTVLTGNKGTEIIISSNSFQFENGEVPTAKIKIFLKEIYSASQIILNGLSTTSNGQLLETSGMINLKAKSNGKDLKLKEDHPIKIKFKKISDAPHMRTFLGERDSTGFNWNLDIDNVYDTLFFTEEKVEITESGGDAADLISSKKTTYNVVGLDTFEISSVTSQSDGIEGDTASYPIDAAVDIDYYKEPAFAITTTQLNWINCDYFIISPDNIDVSIKIPDYSSSRIYAVFKNINSIMEAWPYKEAFHINRVPKNSKVTIVGITKKDNDFFLSISDKTLKNDGEIMNLNYKRVSRKELINQLIKLDFGFKNK